MSEPALIQQENHLLQSPAQVAKNWAQMGLPVFPCGFDKKPLTPHGFKDATADLDAVTKFWRRNPKALVGIPTGAVSGLFVVDLDTDPETGEAIGEASLAALGLSYLIGTVPTVATPSGGRHLYFRDCDLGNTTNKLGPKIDTRGNGGYIIAPGSVTPAGSYSLLNGLLKRDTLQSAPSAVLEGLQAHAAPSRPQLGFQIDTGPRFDLYADGASVAEVQELLGYIPPIVAMTIGGRC